MTKKKSKEEMKAEKIKASPRVSGYILVNRDKISRAKTYINSTKGKAEGLKQDDTTILKLYDLWGGLVLKGGGKDEDYVVIPTGYFQKEVKESK